jgi:hypothetical protein
MVVHRLHKWSFKILIKGGDVGMEFEIGYGGDNSGRKKHGKQ